MTARARSWVLAAVVLTAGLVGGCHGSSRPGGSPTLDITPSSAPIDAPVSVTVRGLPRHHQVTLSLSGTDASGIVWTARADFQSTAQGTIATTQAPTSGSYHGADAMGLFETLAPAASAPASDDIFRFSRSTRLELQVIVNGKPVAGYPITRTVPVIPHHPFTLARDGLIGTMFTPAAVAGANRPAVLLFGGSEGGESEDALATLLASHGYPALSLAYFKEPGLPATLADIDLRYFVTALNTLREQPGVDPSKLVLYGISRGSEAAQLLASMFPTLVHGVIAGVPSSVVNGPYPNQGRPSWLLDGHALPEVPTYLYGDPDPASVQSAVIRDENIRGPILLACAGQDAVWPSCAYQDAIVARLKAHHFAYPLTALRYPDGGHGVGSAYRYNAATMSAFAALGGDLLPTEQGRADLYQHVLDLLASLSRK